MKLKQAARQALEALKDYHKADDDRVSVAISILQEGLAEQAEQEPVAWIDNKTWCFTYSQYEYEDLDDDMTDDLVPLYTAPVRTKDLTDDEIRDAFYSCGFGAIVVDGCRAVIAADREKNNGTAF